MTRAVLLRHDLPDGSAHLDWLIERPTPGVEHRLVAFRLPLASPPAPLDPAGVTFSASRLPDHRAVYLDHLGPVSGGRGTLSRVAAGRGEILRELPSHILLACAFGGAWRVYDARSEGEGRWRVHPQTPARPIP